MIDARYIKEVTLDGFVFHEINQSIREAIEFAGQLGHHEEWATEKGALVKFSFNEVMVSVRMDSDPTLIHRDWFRAMHNYIDKNVGPYPAPVLTDMERESDSKIQAEQDRKWQERQLELQTKAAAHRAATEAKLTTAPVMSISDNDAWQSWTSKNQDAYGGTVIEYAERWARLMESEMAQGKELEDIATSTSDDADTDGITGFMYGAAVRVLAVCWTHGDRLRKWHNKRYGAPENSEGVVNPAVLVVKG